MTTEPNPPEFSADKDALLRFKAWAEKKGHTWTVAHVTNYLALLYSSALKKE